MTTRIKSILMILVSIVFLMIGFAYAFVPIYQLFCQVTGLTIKTSSGIESDLTTLKGLDKKGVEAGELLDSESVKSKVNADKYYGKSTDQSSTQKIIRVRFNADVQPDLDWKFYPTESYVDVILGEPALSFYKAENLSSTSVIGVATYNVLPIQAGLYFNKIQCFCFEEQQLNANEKIEMPVLFFLDPEILNDPALSDIESVTLSYTFFRKEA